MLPQRVYVGGGESWWGTFRFTEPVAWSTRVNGVVLLFACVAASVEAYRRGSRADKVASCMALLLTLAFMAQFFSSLITPTRSP